LGRLLRAPHAFLVGKTSEVATVKEKAGGDGGAS
jgi:hypothetical protein